jgi:serine/threonine protein kinase
MNYGRYQIVKELGKGSMGVVYQAYDPQIDRVIALKVLRQDRSASEAFVQRFLTEAKAIGRLSHPNIVTVFDVGQDQGMIYIAMEFLEGKPLDKIIEDRSPSLEEIIRLSVFVALALDYAHGKGIIHRDIKPSNILIAKEGLVKITDFGIAHIEDPASPLQTQAGEILGTPAYMSPEQVLSRTVDGRSDLFSLGIILYEMTTGKRPFTGENLAAIFNAVTKTTPAEPKKINPSISKDLSQVIMKSLNKMPEQRFQTGKAFAEALGATIKGNEPVNAPTPAGGRSRIPLYAVINLVLLVVISGLAYLFFKDKPVPPTPVEKQVVTSVAPVTPAATAYLKVESTPSGAQCFIDGKFRGETPSRFNLLPGKHEVRLILPEHLDWEAEVQVDPQAETPLSVQLLPVGKK